MHDKVCNNVILCQPSEEKYVSSVVWNVVLFFPRSFVSGPVVVVVVVGGVTRGRFSIGSD